MNVIKKEMDVLLAVMDRAEEPDAFATREEFVKEFVRVLDQARGERAVFFGLTVTAGVTSNFGPFSTRHQATQAVEKTPAEKAWIVPGRSAEGWAVWIGEVNSPAQTKGDFAEVQKDVIAFRRGWNGKGATRQKYLDAAS